jgi:hypothetical protein
VSGPGRIETQHERRVFYAAQRSRTIDRKR